MNDLDRTTVDQLIRSRTEDGPEECVGIDA